MDSFEDKLSEHLVDIIQKRDEEREKHRKIFEEEYEKLKFLFDNIKESFHKRNVSVSLICRFGRYGIEFKHKGITYSISYSGEKNHYYCFENTENKYMKNIEEVYEFLYLFFSRIARFE